MSYHRLLRKLYAAAVYTISGIVYDADGVTAVANALVTLGAYSALSGADGAYTITGIPAGTSGPMTCVKVGYSWTAITVAAMSGNLTSQNFSNAQWAAGGCAALCVGAWNPMGAASYAASKLTLAGVATCVDGAAYPTWDVVNGWKFLRTSSQYLVTDLVPNGNQTWSMLIRFSNGDGFSTYQSLAGCITGTTVFFWLWIASVIGGTKHNYGNGTQYRDVGAILTSGRIEMCGKNCYLNGVSDGTISAGTGTHTRTIYIGCRNNDGVADIFATAYIQKLWVYNADVFAYIASLDAALAL